MDTVKISNNIEESIETWEKIPEINNLWKDDSLEFKKFCGQLFTNQASFLTFLAESQLKLFLQLYNFKDCDDVIINVYKFAKINWEKYSDALYAASANRITIEYGEVDGKPRIYNVDTMRMQPHNTDYLIQIPALEKALDYRICIRVPFGMNTNDDPLQRNRKIWYGDYIILRIKPNNSSPEEGKLSANIK